MQENELSPRLVGFDNFMKMVNDPVKLNVTAGVHRVIDETEWAIVGSFHHHLSASAAQIISSNADDKI